MEKNFKKGDKFIPRKPKETTTYQGWTKGMNPFDGKIQEVKEITINGWLQSRDNGYCFHADWCEKVEDTHIPDVREIVGSIELPNNQEHIVEANKMVDWDYWRNEFAKSAMQGLIATGWNIYEVPNLVGKSIEISNEMIKQLKEQ